MNLKIYFGEKPLFLCEEVTPDIEPFLHHDDAVLIEELSPHAVNSMLHEMQVEKVHAGVFVHPDLEKLKKAIWKKFTVLQAAGGLVTNSKDEVLFIFRRNSWDLPKGKLEENEELESCALREVEEETGITNLRIKRHLLTTYHTYHEHGKFILKESYWYEMKVRGDQKLTPQTEEDITEIRWVPQNEIEGLLKNSFPSIRDVIQAFKSVNQ